MMMRATLSPRMLMADRLASVGAISERIASLAKDPDLLVTCADGCFVRIHLRHRDGLGCPVVATRRLGKNRP